VARNAISPAVSAHHRQWDHLLKWNVTYDIQVENATPQARTELYNRCQRSNGGSGAGLSTTAPAKPSHVSKSEHGEGPSTGAALDGSGGAEVAGRRVLPTVRDLVLGGDDKLVGDKYIGLERVKLSSPEYKSPAPPDELFYQFPLSRLDTGSGSGAPAPRPIADAISCLSVSSEGSGSVSSEGSASVATTGSGSLAMADSGAAVDAASEIRLLFTRVLKHPTESAPILCPTISDIGQSASSIHVHVNVRNPAAWPRQPLTAADDVPSTRRLLAVVATWIRFDSVIRTFSKPWMWRDRSLAPMFATGPEFMHQEVAWKQGTTPLDEAAAASLPTYNVPSFFRHVFQTYRCGVDGADVDGADVDGADVDGADVDGADVVAPDTNAAPTASPSGMPACASHMHADASSMLGGPPVGEGRDPAATAGAVAAATPFPAFPQTPQPLQDEATQVAVGHRKGTTAGNTGSNTGSNTGGNTGGNTAGNTGNNVGGPVCNGNRGSQPTAAALPFGAKETSKQTHTDDEAPSALFARVFDDDVIRSTLFRNCSLNLLALKKYGTVEIRRMHATLDQEFVVAWTRFCVAFVEKVGRDYPRFGARYFDSPDDWAASSASPPLPSLTSPPSPAFTRRSACISHC
jgi:hypothetical protein